EVESKIARLVDALERDDDSPEIRQRLVERRREREDSAKRLECLRRTQSLPQQEPTVEWISEQLENLSQVLHGDKPAAACALRALIGGQVLVHEIRDPNRKRFFVQGKFVIELGHVVRAIQDAVSNLEDAIDKPQDTRVE